MGNLCGKPSKENDPFSQPGRAVGSIPPPPPNPRASVPKISSQGQKLGGSSGGEGSDARSAAARAAEVRIYFFPLQPRIRIPLELEGWILY